MTKLTHERGGFTTVILLYPFILTQVKTISFPSAVYMALFLMLCLVLMFGGSRYGTQYPDYDHQNEKSIPVRNLLTIQLNRFLKLLGATHRSWHTHSIDVTLIIFGIPTYLVYIQSQVTTGAEAYVWFLSYVFLLSFTSAVVMHLILDLFTIGGGYISIILAVLLTKLVKKVDKRTKITQFKVVLAPKWLKYPTFGVDTNGVKRFHMKAVYDSYTTNSTYEKDFRNILKNLNYVAFAVSIILLISYM